MGKLVIKKATIEHMEELKRLRKELIVYEIEKLGNTVTDVNWPLSESSTKDFEYFINKQIIFMAEYEGKAAGYICGEILPKDDWNLFQIASLTNLFVNEKYRSLGIGTELVKVFKEECKKQNIEHIELHTLCNNPATEFYAKNGFNAHSTQMLAKI